VSYLYYLNKDYYPVTPDVFSQKPTYGEGTTEINFDSLWLKILMRLKLPKEKQELVFQNRYPKDTENLTLFDDIKGEYKDQIDNGTLLPDRYILMCEDILNREKIVFDDKTPLISRAGAIELFNRALLNGKFGWIGVIMIDIKCFKAFNDLLGHDDGDGYLYKVGETIIHQVRERMFAARDGGDEFYVFFTAEDEKSLTESMTGFHGRLKYAMPKCKTENGYTKRIKEELQFLQTPAGKEKREKIGIGFTDESTESEPQFYFTSRKPDNNGKKYFTADDVGELKQHLIYFTKDDFKIKCNEITQKRYSSVRYQCEKEYIIAGKLAEKRIEDKLSPMPTPKEIAEDFSL
jgi:diguanylate cyclase (GGDEF)-like protein